MTSSEIASAVYDKQLEAAQKMLAALREITKGAPEEDPGEGCWDSMADAWDAGVAAQTWDTAETAREAIATAEAAGIKVEE